MFRTRLQNVALAAASSVLVCAAGGCGTDWTATSQDVLDSLPQPAAPTTTQKATQAGQGDTGAGQDTAAAEAGQLLQEIETILGGQNAGTASDGLNALLTGLAAVAGSSLNSATSQPAIPAHPFRQLRTEIRTLRHSLTREQAAQLLLSALAASNTSDGSAGMGTGSSNLVAQVQNLLGTLRALNTQSTTP